MLKLVTPVDLVYTNKVGHPVISSFKIYKPVFPSNKKQKIRPILKSAS